jgi:hypothetical protein
VPQVQPPVKMVSWLLDGSIILDVIFAGIGLYCCSEKFLAFGGDGGNIGLLLEKRDRVLSYNIRGKERGDITQNFAICGLYLENVKKNESVQVKAKAWSAEGRFPDIIKGASRLLEMCLARNGERGHKLRGYRAIEGFQNTMSEADINLGVHGGGHFSIGLGLQDFFASPADPTFFLHHGMIDRVWTIWQAADPHVRQFQLSGTSTIFNGNNTPQVTLDTMQDWGVLGGGRKTGSC